MAGSRRCSRFAGAHRGHEPGRRHARHHPRRFLHRGRQVRPVPTPATGLRGAPARAGPAFTPASPAQERDSRQRLGGERPPRDSALVPCGRAPVLGRQRRALAVRVATAPRLDRVVAASAFSGPHPGSSEPPSCSRDHSSPQRDSRAGRCTLPGMAGDRLPAPDEALGPGSSLRPSLWRAWEASGVLLWSLALPSISFYNKLTETCAQVSWAQVHRHTMLRHLLHTEQIRRFKLQGQSLRRIITQPLSPAVPTRLPPVPPWPCENGQGTRHTSQWTVAGR